MKKSKSHSTGSAAKGHAVKAVTGSTSATRIGTAGPARTGIGPHGKG